MNDDNPNIKFIGIILVFLVYVCIEVAPNLLGALVFYSILAGAAAYGLYFLYCLVTGKIDD